MKYVDQDFLQQELFTQGNGYLPFIEWSTSELIRENGMNNLMINTTEVYWLYFYIKGNVRSTLAQFLNQTIDNDIFGFPTAQRELRHSIEAYLDLYNLVRDKNYKCVLKYCSNSNKKGRNNIALGDFQKSLPKTGSKQFTIKSKYDISGLNNRKLMEMSVATNSYTHPDVYLDLSKIVNNKEELVNDILKMNMYLLSESYELFIKGIESNGGTTQLLNNIITAYNTRYEYQKYYAWLKERLNNQLSHSLVIYQPDISGYNYMV